MLDLPAWRISSALRLETSIPAAFDVRRFSVDDGLNMLFSVQVEAMSQDPAIDFEELVGQPAAFHIDLDASAYGRPGRRTWAGVVSEAQLLRSEPGGLSRYRVTLAPRMWLLTRRTNCRVFQQMTDLDVAHTILAEWGITLANECRGSYKTRKYRVQYQETDFAFVSRLLEASGVSYWFRDSDGATELVLGDAPEAGAERSAPLDYSDEPVQAALFATGLSAARALTSGRIAVADHDHRLPNAPLVASAAASAQAVESQLEQFMYRPGWFRYGNPGPKDTPVADDRGRTRTDHQEARRMAEQLGAAAMTRARRVSFETNALDLAPGLRLTVAQHPLTERVGALLVTRTVVTGDHDGEARVAATTALASSAFEPDLTTPQPQIMGLEMATVVGPAGEEIHCDEFGRVRVQFHWDRYGAMDEKSSCWIPVNQPWAGSSMGAINIPRVGQEVMVGFLGGNPEEPMIVGRTFTNLMRPPYPLPASKNINGFKSQETSGGGGKNELCFDDSNAGLRMYRHAGKNEDTETVENRTEWVGKSRNQKVDLNRSAQIGGNDKKEVGGNAAKAVQGNDSSSVLGDKIGSVLGNLLSMAGGERIMQTIGNMVSSALSHSIESLTNTTIKVGASSITLTPDAIILNSPKILLNPGDKAAESAAIGQSPAAGVGAS